ncbi:uncharacterized protein BO97DRAFT_271500 [Aspergillus homomorphus CBS 101889]|uniref:Uncharacterized protein n=1 Tax=Aspergillus homomorphus (strain CBS 101889) TaxID=1450537 RepID=A0A395I5N9_ASPHC|nr:hypothetical protein BO97DRAFT_271500 [Aspergillus homomorphus CBS 101889]RAL14508.1 hypothetical protein BO97DRAFT_271500 [Aspergillus homomorphus CBS 101889]
MPRQNQQTSRGTTPHPSALTTRIHTRLMMLSYCMLLYLFSAINHETSNLSSLYLLLILHNNYGHASQDHLCQPPDSRMLDHGFPADY